MDRFCTSFHFIQCPDAITHHVSYLIGEEIKVGRMLICLIDTISTQQRQDSKQSLPDPKPLLEICLSETEDKKNMGALENECFIMGQHYQNYFSS